MKLNKILGIALGTVLIGTAAIAQVDSGSICATLPADPDCLGDVTYSIDTEVPLPPDGILQYGALTVDAGVTVTFTPNVLNTPAFILASGDVTINGAIDVSAPLHNTPGGATACGVRGDGNLGDDGIPGRGGPGGGSGGAGGLGGNNGGGFDAHAESGHGPGGGDGGGAGSSILRAAGGGYGTAGAGTTGVAGGSVYGQASLQPLNGGSGGGGGGGGTDFNGAGGGGGGGGLLIACNGTFTINSAGRLWAEGRNGGDTGYFGNASYPNHGGGGGGGSGGAIRVVCEMLAGTGQMYARGGSGSNVAGWGTAPNGGTGRIRLEANTFTYTGTTNPTRSFDVPGPIFVPNSPTLAITGVGGTAVPATPTGDADVTLPETVAQPVTITVTASEIPLGTTVTVTVIPQGGPDVSAVTNALAGTLASSTASVDMTLPSGPSTLEARANFTLVLGGGMSNNLLYEGEAIKLAEVSVGSEGESEVTYITESGKRVAEDEVGPLTYAMLRAGEATATN